MKITIAPQQVTTTPLVVHTGECWWDVTTSRFTMVRGIFDGCYPMPIDCEVKPLELHAADGGLRVLVGTAAEAERLARALKEGYEFCQKSYETMYV